MRIHLCALPHTNTTREYSYCAYTQKIRKLSTMLHRIGHEVILYAGPENEAECKEHVVVITKAEQEYFFGLHDPNAVFNDFDADTPHWRLMNFNVVNEMADRIQPGDIVGITMGYSQAGVADFAAERGAFPVEVGIGYSGVLPNTYKVFESHAWRHHIAGLTNNDTVHFYSTVIPNFFETDAFPLGTGSGDYYLFLGRLTERKGPLIAAEACKRIGARLVVAGQGHMDLPGDIEYVGVVDEVERADLLGNAIATFTPSTYLEPFCGVSVESQLCGTPVIATNWGAFTENIRHGESGYLCDTLAEFAAAAELAPMLSRPDIREYAALRWSTDTLAYEYDRFFNKLLTLRDAGWYT